MGANEAGREQLYADLRSQDMAPLWASLHTLVPREPATPCVAAL